MGVDSGLPDFRGNEGFWKAYPPMAKLGVSFVEMANPWWFERDPSLAWGFYGHRLNLYRRTVPHGGFKRLLEIGKKKKEGYFVFTSNVDGQFQIAGFDEDRIEECHGSLHHLQCLRPCSQDIWEAREVNPDVDETQFRARDPLPRCPKCGALARPNVLMFNDWDWIPHRTRIQGDRLHRWIEGLSRSGAALAVVETGRRQGRGNRPDDLRGRRPGREGHPDPDQSPRLRRPRRPHRHPVRGRRGDPQDPRKRRGLTVPIAPPSLHLNSPKNGCIHKLGHGSGSFR